MTRKQRDRLNRNRPSQRLAFAEHAKIARAHGVDSIESNYVKPGMLMRNMAARDGFVSGAMRCKETRRA